MESEAVVCYSGGIDSTVLVYDLLNQGYTVTGFGVDYGQGYTARVRAKEWNGEWLYCNVHGTKDCP